MYDIDDMYHYLIAIVLRCYNAASVDFFYSNRIYDGLVDMQI